MSKTVPLAADLALFANALKVEKVTVPGFPHPVYVKELSGIDRERYEQGLTSGAQDKGYVRAMLVACTLCNEQGELLFTIDQVPTIAGWKARVLVPLADKAAELAALGEADMQALEGNS